MDYIKLATEYLESSLEGRYITTNHVIPLLTKNNKIGKVEIVGKSVLENPIHLITVGTGPTKVLIWSQMHGNESTTTKGLFDFLNFLQSTNDEALTVLNKYSIYIVPILNPDGAIAYTRNNANDVDLNRDALLITQPESKILRHLIETIAPDICYNLHDQRTIFGTENYRLPATMSFLAPAFSEQRLFNDVRMKSVAVINRINSVLQGYIPNQIGRFDDSFNENCIGDYAISRGIPTLLFEAGHYQDDYQRDWVRKYVFISLLASFLEPSSSKDKDTLDYYLQIPKNSQVFYDIIYKNVKIIKKNEEKIINFAVQFFEELKGNRVDFVARIIQIDGLDDFKGHVEFDAKEMTFSMKTRKFPKINQKANFYLNNMLKISNGLQIL